MGLDVEIADVSPIKKIGIEEAAGEHLAAEPAKFVRKKQKPACDQARGKNDGKGGKNTSNPTGIELPVAKTLRLDAILDQTGDEVARNDKKDVDADKSAPDVSWKSVKSDDGENRDRPQSVNIGAIFDHADPTMR
ncbi:MAG: hypothetical protein WDM81_18720 [Rhizomicrobium sp.]